MRAFAPWMVLIAAIAGVAFWRSHSGSSQPSGPSAVPPTGEAAATSGPSFTVIHSDQPPHRVLLEAENAEEIGPPCVLKEGTEGAVVGASGGKCCYIGPEKVNETPKMAQLKKGHPQARHAGYARYTFEVPATDEYALWLRAYWVDDCGDSVSLSINGSRPRPLSGTTYGRWLWNLFRTGEGTAARVRLEAGKPHTLVICNREDDLYFDQILLLGTDRPWPDPTGEAKP